MTANEPQTDIEDLHPAEQVDVAIGLRAVAWKDHPAVKIAATVAELADQPQLFSICAGVSVAGLVLGRPRLLLAGLRMTAAFGLATAAKSAVKHRVTRTRPETVVEEGVYEAHPEGTPEHGRQSFPSGHTAGAVAVARALARSHPAAGSVALVAALGAGMIQVPKGGHWPIDVAAGLGLGLVSEAASNGVFRAFSKLI